MQKRELNIEFIQILRGIAALLVVLYHGREYIGGNDSGTIANTLLMPSGTMGVDLFFLISGFIMVCTTWNSNGSWQYTKNFYIKRVARILPVYAILTIFTMYIDHRGWSFLRSADDMESLGKAMLFIPQGDLGSRPIYGLPPLSVGWTLNYEIYFYLIFGACLLFKRLRWAVLAAIAGITLTVVPLITDGQFSANVYGIYNYSFFYLNMITNPIIWLFIAGAGIGGIYKSGIKVPSNFWCGVLTATSIMLVVWQYLSQYQVNHGITLWGFSLVPLVLCLAICSRTITFPTPKVMIYLGDISFSLYLIHMPVKKVLEIIFYRIGVPASGASLFVAMVGASIIAAAISHRYLEQSLSNLLKRKLLAV